MACCDPSENFTELMWDEDSGVCTQLESVCSEGVRTTTPTTLTPSDCCSAGTDTDDATLRMACEDSTTVTLTWDKDNDICTALT